MSITYREAEGLFTLHTRHTTYQMGVDSLRVLRHLYYGDRAEGADFRSLYADIDRGFSGNLPDLRYDRSVSLDTMPQEYTGFGVGDFRITALRVREANGDGCTQLRYVSHRIIDGKYALPGLPAAYDNGGEAQTLELTLRDAASSLTVRLLYGVFEERDVITRAVEIRNEGDSPVQLKKAASMCLDLPFGPWELVHFHGRHCMERQLERHRLSSAIETISSTRTQSSHHHNPFTILCEPGAGEDWGACYGFMLAWSGNHKTEFEVDQTLSTRVVMGIHDDGFSWRLDPGEGFFTPEAILTYSASGFTTLSHQYHDFIRHNITRGKYKLSRRPVLLNNWEATYFNFNEEKLLHIARQAAALGVELFVLDDGWFGRRDDDNAGLGDWIPNTRKLPGGLGPLIKEINAMGLQFGLWLEPEMINEDSDLYRAHPDWVLSAPDRAPMLCRNQLVLDMGREDVRNYLYDSIAKLLRDHPIAYIKWDMNRSVSDVYSRVLPPERQGEASHRYVLGLYDLLNRLTGDFPDVLFEGCSGGGGRFDAGMMYYTPQIWCSDDTDPIERLVIQHGTSFGYPISTVGAHVSASPNHQTGRQTSLHTRGIVAMSGTFGYELDLNRLTDAEKEEVRDQIAAFHHYAPLIQDGLYYRLTGAGERDFFTAWEFAARDGSAALLNMVIRHTLPNPIPIHVRLKGLDREARYEIEGQDVIRTGAELMCGGYTFPFERIFGDYASVQIHFVRIADGD